MKRLAKAVVLSSAVVMAAGCSIYPAPADLPVEKVGYSSANSVAMNIANQTDLSLDYAYGGRNYDSPLRDFTKKEIEAEKASLKNKSNTGAFVAGMGLLRILTLDLTGVIDVAGGGATGLSSQHDQHPARKSRWFVSVPASEYKSANAAKEDISNKITAAILSTYDDYGVTYKKEYHDLSAGKINYTTAQMPDGKIVYLGGVKHVNQLDEKVEPVIKQIVNFGKGDFLSYSVGLRAGYNKDKLIGKMGLSPFLYPNAVNGDTLDDFLKKLTAKLPENYFYYQVSYPRFNFNNKIYTQLSIDVPAIYTQGKRYDFIKPENNKK